MGDRPASDRDGLTGLGRSGTFQAALDARHDGAGSVGEYTVGLVDVVGLRHVNRDHGGRAGDDLLRQVADRLVKSGSAQLVCRVGADEFALLADGVGERDARAWVRSLRRTVLERPFTLAGHPRRVEFRITLSGAPLVWRGDRSWPVEPDAELDHAPEPTCPMDAWEHRARELSSLAHENERLRENVAALRELAMRDPLTRLYNRRGMADRLEAGPPPATIGLVDLDDLRLLNSLDELWDDGDAAIVGVADRQREAFGERNVARWGGDEFLVVSDARPHEVAAVLERVLARCRDELVISGRPITFSAGLSSTEGGIRAGRLRAQRALKKAKAQRATIVVDGTSA